MNKFEYLIIPIMLALGGCSKKEPTPTCPLDLDSYVQVGLDCALAASNSEVAALYADITTIDLQTDTE